ncbi:aldo/keto reductase [Cellulomonas sp. PhB143]|uniref:aldo/keto reductase n=1 Tax=Cellulomonas sp. PhB143 TaxID=2485186 RepID=UPI000F4A5759|nr:aldo/keto reductase [Cellulomonas sp. PhB143]ROS79174.1 2,5-diketo-D-gluconate reductase A [Cellulomonas sp. PhB143]
MSAESAVPRITLNNGVQIPQLGFGVFQIPPEDTRAATLTALETGYRHIDTAEMYGNEEGVGQAIKASGLDRSDVFVTSKLNNGFHEPEAAATAFDATLEALDSDYVDLFLIHWPLPDVGDFTETWGAMEEIYRSGRAKAIGVSNFQPHHLRKIHASGTIVPAVNQIEVHPYFQQDEVRSFNAQHEIITEAWSPIAQGAVLDDPVIGRIADSHGKSPAQVVLRWHTERGDVVFPKSVTPERVRENFALFDFELTEDDMAAMAGLERGARQGGDPDTFNYVPS